jgi:hypothetical protein
MNDLLKEMSATIMKEIYNYGQPDGSDYTEYMKIPANAYFEKIKKTENEITILEYMLNWSMYEAFNIHNVSQEKIAEQEELASFIVKEANKNDLNITEIKENIVLLKFIKQIAFNILDEKVFSFISYCMFASKDCILNGNAYWKQINTAILKKVYLDSLNVNKDERWEFLPTCFITTGPGRAPIPVGPNHTQGPKYKLNNENKLYAEYYLPQTDVFRGIEVEILPISSEITIQEVYNWCLLDFIIKPEINKQSCPRMYYTDRARSSRRAIHNLMQLLFTDYVKNKKKKEIELFVTEIFNDLFLMFLGEMPKTEIGYFEAKPAIVYCLYRAIKYLSIERLNCWFYKIKPNFLKDEFLFFQNLKKQKPAHFVFTEMVNNYENQKITDSCYEQIQNQSKEDMVNSEKIQKEVECEKYSILCMMFYFLLWDIGKQLPVSPYVTEESLAQYFFQHGELMEKFYEPFIDESWNKEYGENSEERKKNRRMNTTWTDPQKWLELFNLLLKNYKINNTITNLPINIFNFENIELKTELLKVLLSNFSQIEEKQIDKLLNLMDFAGELKEHKNLYCQPKKNMMFASDDAVEEEIMTLKNNQKTLKEIDCGFEVDNYVQIPVPCISVRDRSHMLLRKFTCRFFSDTDKKYRYEKRGKRKNMYTIQCYENYRETNKNNFFCHTLYAAERNTARHYVDMYSLSNILDDTYPSNMLEAFIDAKDFILSLKEEKKNSQTALLILEYQLDFLTRHLYMYAEKYNLLENPLKAMGDIWDIIYTNDKNINGSIKNKFSDSLDYAATLGMQYLREVKWFFENLYCIASTFKDSYYSSIAMYLVYLTINLQRQ